MTMMNSKWPEARGRGNLHGGKHAQFEKPGASDRGNVCVWWRLDRAAVNDEVGDQLLLDVALVLLKHFLKEIAGNANPCVRAVYKISAFQTLRKVSQLSNVTSASSHNLNTRSQNARTTCS